MYILYVYKQSKDIYIYIHIYGIYIWHIYIYMAYICIYCVKLDFEISLLEDKNGNQKTTRITG